VPDVYITAHFVRRFLPRHTV